MKTGYKTQEFVAALATPGEANSSLQKRKILPQTIRAKTGSMSGINCLCGYSLKDKDPKAFVFIANSFSPPASEIADLMDHFVAQNLID